MNILLNTYVRTVKKGWKGNLYILFTNKCRLKAKELKAHVAEHDMFLSTLPMLARLALATLE